MADRLIIGMTGASGTIYGIHLMQLLRELKVETHLVLTQSAEVTLAHETDWKVSAVRALASHWYKIDDIGGVPQVVHTRRWGWLLHRVLCGP